MFKNALISVSDKTNLVELIHPLYKKGMRLVSTGGTADFLRKNGFAVIEVSEQTGFKEIMNGRLKSLHPRIYMPLLSRLEHEEDTKALQAEGLKPFDLVICNLYPFEFQRKKGIKDLVEWIDVGGPSLLRAAAKNFNQITVLCDPNDYSIILKKDAFSLEKRKTLAGKAFRLLAEYNKAIADWFENTPTVKKTPLYNNSTFRPLRYGENPHQSAVWKIKRDIGLHCAVPLQGKELSFNNICDLDSAFCILKQFQQACAVAVKHNNPCAVACSNTLEQAIKLALKADPISVFGSVVALNHSVNQACAEALCSLFLEVILAPDYSAQALKIFQKKKNLRVLKWSKMNEYILDDFRERSVEGGFLKQSVQTEPVLWDSKWRHIGEKPPISIQSDMLMAWKVCAFLKSNAIAIVSQNKTVGLGMGQVNRIDAVEQAIHRWKQFHSSSSSPVLASDGFFPFSDSIELIAQSGIKWIIQPGGSIKDKEVIATTKKLSVNMILTDKRCFIH